MLELRARGVRFNVVGLGNGATVLVMVHGLLLDNHAGFYLTVAPALAKRARVILYDLRGHGRSEQPPTGYTADDMAQDLAGILDGMGLEEEKVVVVGNSFGGHVALRFAVLYPHRVRGLVLLESHSGSAELGEQMAGTLRLEGQARKDKIDELVGHWLTQHAAPGQGEPGQLDAGSLDRDGRATVEKFERLGRRRRSSVATAAQTLRDGTSFVQDLASLRPLNDGDLARITAPVLALYGADSDLRSDGERLAQHLPHCRLRIIPGCGHGVLFHATAEVRETMLGWMDEVGL